MEFKDLDDKDGIVPDDDGAPDDIDGEGDDWFENEDPDIGPDVLPVDDEDEDTRDTDPNAVVPENEDALDHLTTEEIDQELGFD